MGIFNKNRRTTSGAAASTLIAKGCVVSGELKVENDIQIDGTVDGKINVEGTLVVAESGQVKGDIYAKQIIVNGSMEGNCHTDHIQILAKGRVRGKLWSNNLSIEPGGKFFGETAQQPESVQTKTQDTAKEKEVVTLNTTTPEKATSEKTKLEKTTPKDIIAQNDKRPNPRKTA